MERPARTTCLLLATVAACAAIDLTTFRTDSAHQSLLSWNADLRTSGTLETDSASSRFARGFSTSGWVEWQSSTKSENLDWLVKAPVYARYGSGASTSWGDTNLDFTDDGGELRLLPELGAFAYEPGTDLHIFCQIDGRIDLSSSSRSTGESNRSRVYEARGDVGLGWGRIRDAWPLLKATYIERILAEEGVLNRRLTDEELHEIAAFLSRSWKLFLAHDRGSRHLYDSLATLLARTGATRGPLPARALMRLDEDLYVGSFTRRFGCRLSAGASFGSELQARVWTYEDTSGSVTDSRFDIYPSALLTFARPLGLRTLYDLELRYSHLWDQTEHDDFEHRLGLGLTIQHQILDRFEVSLLSELSTRYIGWTYTNGEHRQLYLDSGARLGCSYYLAERLRIIGGVSWSGHLYQGWTRGREEGCDPEAQGRFSLDLRLHWGRLPQGWEGRGY